jgi:signal recognition particle subunit SRP54
MFDTLGDRLNKALDGVRGSGNLTEDQVKKVTREIRLALLEADVNYGVVKTFVSNVRERATGAEVSKALSPGQQVVKIVNDELANLMGGTAHKLSFASRPPTVVMLAASTAMARLRPRASSRCSRGSSGRTLPGRVRHLPPRRHRPVAADRARALRAGLHGGHGPKPEEIAERGIKEAGDAGYDFVIVDTAGRQVVDMDMMER